MIWSNYTKELGRPNIGIDYDFHQAGGIMDYHFVLSQ